MKCAGVKRTPAFAVYSLSRWQATFGPAALLGHRRFARDDYSLTP